VSTREHRHREIERRQRAATRAVETKRRRRDARLEHIAAIIASGKSAGPSSKCLICRRRLVDETAVSRGIGSECWGDVQGAIEARRAA
jgi:Family of unknown function (DUF6011)